MVLNQILDLVEKFNPINAGAEVRHEAVRRVVDSIGCAMGSFPLNPVRRLREFLIENGDGGHPVWGTRRRLPPQLAAWANGAAVRALDFNDTYLSKEPCHPSDLLSSIWAASTIAGHPRPGRDVVSGIILGYDVLCRLCDAASIRVLGWDHVTYLPIASAAACSKILGLSRAQTGHAISLALTGHVAMRQTRVGEISDWKAGCAAYGAQAGLWAALLAKRNFTGPSEIFEGRHGFFAQVSKPFRFRTFRKKDTPMILKTHTKFFPAEHHAQSAIEAAQTIHSQIGGTSIQRIQIDTFDVSYKIIGSDKEKFVPKTRETADHSIPYLVAATLLDGTVTLAQYEKNRFLKPDVRRLMRQTRVRSNPRYDRLYPRMLPNRVTVWRSNGEKISAEVLRPKGYAGRPMTDSQINEKFYGLTKSCFTNGQRKKLLSRLWDLENLKSLSGVTDILGGRTK